MEEVESGFYDPVKNAVVKAIENIEKQTNFSNLSEEDYLITGIQNLDFHKGDFIVLGAQPSIGNTAFALSLLNSLAVEQKIPVGYISCGNMEYAELGQRLISMTSGVGYTKIRRGIMNMNEVSQIQEASTKICESPFYIYDEPNISFAELEMTATMMVKEQNARLIVIDSFEYLQEVVDSKKDLYRLHLEDLLNDFKKMAKELNVPVILLIGMPHSKKGCQPSIKDFKKYMIIPRLADMVLFLHRDRYMEEEDMPGSMLIVAKNENGPCYSIDMKFSPKTVSFEFELSPNGNSDS